MKRTPAFVRLVLVLALLLPVYFAVAALGTRFGLWDWKFGLGVLTVKAGPIVLGVVGIAALVALIVDLIRRPRRGLWAALIALLIPLAIFSAFAVMRGRAADIPPIHDVSTDLRNPPALPASTLAAREAVGANAINDYATPLGQIEMWRHSDPELARQSHAGLIAANYPELQPLPLGTTEPAAALAAVAEAMRAMGFQDVKVNAQARTVSGVAQTFWFGFKDDVVARIADDRIDFRSVSRVGRSDLGANAARIAELREQAAQRIAS